MNLRALAAGVLLGWTTAVQAQLGAGRIDYVQMAADQLHSTKPEVIWYDDFDQDRLNSYMEPPTSSPNARRSSAEALGGRGSSMECFYAKGSQGVGNRKLVFGDSPIGRPLRRGEKFQQVYWRVYVKHQAGWVGNPDKLTRATGMVSARWNQSFISHVWSSGSPLTLDPASGVRNGAVLTTRYNDFPNLRWLGNSPKGRFPLHSTAESGRWVCVESMVRVNTPDRKDGSAALWVDGVLDAERKNLDFIGSYTGPGSTVNAIFLEAYWNAGSPTNQYRWYDDFVVSTEPIGPVVADKRPVLVRRTDLCDAWQVEVGPGNEGKAVAISKELPGGALRAELDLPSPTTSQVLFCRIRLRESGSWGEWSPWHQPFAVRL